MEGATMEQIAQLLYGILQPNTEVITKSTAMLKEYFKLPQSIDTFLALLTHQDSQIRLLCCICLKKKILKHWPNIDQQKQTQIKEYLLKQYQAEVENKVRENLGACISNLCATLLPHKEWPQLIEYIGAIISEQDHTILKCRVQMFTLIIENMGPAIDQFATEMKHLIFSVLQSQDKYIQSMGVNAFLNICRSRLKHKTLMQFEDLIPTIVELIKKVDSIDVEQFFDIMSDIIEIPKFLNNYLEPLIQIALELGANKSAAFHIRQLSLYFVELALENKARAIKKMPIIMEKIIKACILIASEKETDYSEDEDTPVDCAIDVFERLAKKIPNTIIFTPLMTQMNISLSSTNPLERRAALLIIGAISKGVEDPMKENLKEIVQLVLKYMGDVEQTVKEAAVLCYCYFSDNLSPEIYSLHSSIMPSLIESLKTPSIKYLDKVLYAISVFCEGMIEEEMAAYADVLFSSIIGFLKHPNIEIHRSALSALTGVACSAKKTVLLNYSTFITQLMYYITGEGSHDSCCKSKAIIIMGRVAFNIGKEKYAPYYETMGKIVEEQFSTNFEMNEAVWNYFKDMAMTVKHNILPKLEALVQWCLKSCLSEEGIKKVTKKEEFSLDTDSENDEGKETDVRTAFIDEKSAALLCLGELSLACPKEFMNYLDISLEVVEKMWDYFHENIRYQLVTLIESFLESRIMASNEGIIPKYIKGFDAKPLQPIDKKFAEEVVMKRFFSSIYNDEDKEVASRALQSSADLIRKIGPSLIMDKIDDFITIIVDLLKRNAECQKEDNDEDVDDGEDENENEEDAKEEESNKESNKPDTENEDIDHDELLMVTITDSIAAICEVFGESISSKLGAIINELIAYTKPPHPKNDAVLAIGAFADIFKYLPSTILSLQAAVLPICLDVIKTTSDHDSIRNCSFCLGMAIEGKPEIFQGKSNAVYAILLEAIKKCEREAKENIISTIARLLAYTEFKSDDAMNLLVSNLPLVHDAQENKFVVQSLILICLKGMPTSPQILKSIGLTGLKVLVDPKCEADEECKAHTAAFIKEGMKNEIFMGVLKELCGSMSAEESQILQKYLN